MFIFIEKPFSPVPSAHRTQRLVTPNRVVPNRAVRIFATLMLAASVFASPIFAAPAQDSATCSSVSFLGPNAASELAATGPNPCFEVEITEPGILMLGLLTAEPASLRPATRALTLHRSAQDLVLAVEAGRHLFEIASDRGGDLPSPRLISRFVSRDQWLATRPTKSETDNELEIDPDPFVWNPCAESSETDNELEIDPDPLMWNGGSEKSETDNELEIDPDPLMWNGSAEKSETDNELEIDPDPLMAGCGGGSSPNAFPTSYDLSALGARLANALDLLCRRSQNDDHGDLFACASIASTDRVFEGHIDSADSDTFAFHLDTPSTIAIRVASDSMLRGELYDRFGQRLATVSGEEIHSARTLMPGTYFLRLAAAIEAGAIETEGSFAGIIETKR